MTPQALPAPYGVALTRKGERYCDRFGGDANLHLRSKKLPQLREFRQLAEFSDPAHVQHLRTNPSGRDQAANLPLEGKAPIGAMPRRAVARLRAAIEAEVERLLGILDALDGDPDFEPSLAAPESIGGRQLRWATGNRDDLEGDPHEEDEADGSDEPILSGCEVTPGRKMVDGTPTFPDQAQLVDPGMDQRAWAASYDDADREDEFDGREDAGDDEPAGDEQDDRGDGGVGDLDGLSWATGGIVPAAFARAATGAT